MKNILYALIAFVGLTSFTCSNQKIVITESEISNDIFYLDGEIKPFTGICLIPHIDGKSIKEIRKYENGLLTGEAVTYYENGKMKRRGNYKNGKMEGDWEQWFANGQPEVQVKFKNDFMTGYFKEWYANGQLKEEGQYEMNSRVGTWRFYNKKGELMFEKDYVKHAVYLIRASGTFIPFSF